MTTPLEVLEQGIEHWNDWRSRQPMPCSLAGQDLSHGYFFEGNFRNVDLRGANLCRACLVGADFRGADLSGADLSGAYLADVNFQGANLKNTDLSKAQLDRADMRRANLAGTVLNDADISAAQLNDPQQSRYVDEVALLLAQSEDAPVAKRGQRGRGQSAQRLGKKSAAVDNRQSPANEQKRVLNHKFRRLPAKPQPVAIPPKKLPKGPLKKSLKKPVQQSGAPFAGSFVGLERREGEADRRQSIRLSTFVLPTKVGEAAAAKWGRRHADKVAAVQLNQQVDRRRVWRPAMAMAAVAIAVGLLLTLRYAWLSANPDSLPQTKAEAVEATLVSSQERAADGSTDRSLVLAKSLKSANEIKAIATYTLTGNTHRVVAGTASGQIEIWDGQTGQPLSVLTGHADGVSAMAVGRDGRWLVSGGLDGLSVWKPETGELVHHIPQFDSGVATVAIAPKSNTFISSDRVGNVQVWDLRKGELRYQVDTGSAVWSVAIAPDGESFVTGSSDSSIHQWDTATGERLATFVGHQDAVRSVALSADGTTLVSGSTDKTIKLWDVATGALQKTLRDSEPVASIAMSPDGQMLASSSTDQTLKLWDLFGDYSSGSQVSQTLDDDGDSVVAISFDAKQFALVSGDNDNAVKVWRQNL